MIIFSDSISYFLLLKHVNKYCYNAFLFLGSPDVYNTDTWNSGFQFAVNVFQVEKVTLTQPHVNC